MPANDESHATPAKDAIQSDDVEISIMNGMEYGQKRVMLSYANNSAYKIVKLNVSYTLKNDVTLEQFDNAFADLRDTFGAAFEQVNENNLSRMVLNGEVDYPVDSGGESNQTKMTLGSVYITSMEQFDLFEQSMMTISYVANDRIFEETIDLQTGSYALSKDSIDIHQWTTSDLGNAIPRPEQSIIIEADTGSNYFSFTTCGTSEDEFNSYVDSCKEMGYTNISVDGDTRFYADSEDGQYKVDVTFSYPHEGNMSVRVEKIEG